MSSPLTSSFYLLTDDGQRLDETELLAHPERYRAWLRDEHAFPGGIVCQDGTNPPILAADALIVLVKYLCFLSLPALVANRNVVYRYYQQYGYLRLDPEGHLMLISGDGNPTVRFERDACIQALYACGVRFLDLLTQLQGDPPAPGIARIRELLEADRLLAQTALAGRPA